MPVTSSSHLRGLCGMGGPRTVVAGSSEAAQKAVRVRRGGARVGQVGGLPTTVGVALGSGGGEQDSSEN